MISTTKNIIQIFTLDGTGGCTKEYISNVKDLMLKEKPVWVHIHLLNNNDRSIFNILNIPASFTEKLTTERDRPRIISEDDKTFLSLRAINFNPGNDPDDMAFLRIYTKGNLVVTLYSEKVMAIHKVINSLKHRTGPKNIDELTFTTLTNISTEISEVIYEIDDKLDELEDKIIEDFEVSFRSELSSLRHQIINIRRHLLPQQDVVESLSTFTFNHVESSVHINQRELSEKYNRYLAKVDALRDKASITHDELNNIYSERLSKTMFLLSIVATIFMPLSFITGLLGINVGGIPGTSNPIAFLIVSLLLILVGVIEIIIFKFNKWI